MRIVHSQQTFAATPYYANTTVATTHEQVFTVYQPRNRYSYKSKRDSFCDQEKMLAIIHMEKTRHVDGLTCSVWGRVLIHWSIVFWVDASFKRGSFKLTPINRRLACSVGARSPLNIASYRLIHLWIVWHVPVWSLGVYSLKHSSLGSPYVL